MIQVKTDFFINFNSHCLGFVYGDLLQVALHDFKDRWNSHRIRHNRQAGCPPGVPDDIYNLPYLTGNHDNIVYQLGPIASLINAVL